MYSKFVLQITMFQPFCFNLQVFRPIQIMHVKKKLIEANLTTKYVLICVLYIDYIICSAYNFFALKGLTLNRPRFVQSSIASLVLLSKNKKKVYQIGQTLGSNRYNDLNETS